MSVNSVTAHQMMRIATGRIAPPTMRSQRGVGRVRDATRTARTGAAAVAADAVAVATVPGDAGVAMT
jgi:hypothetical protein